MESAKKKRARNSIMVIIIAIIAVVALVMVGNLQGWFGSDSNVSVVDKVGNVNVERSGVSYSLENGGSVENGDTIETLSGSTVTVRSSDGGTVNFNQNTRATLQRSSAGLESGQIVVDALSPYSVTSQEIEISTTDGVFSVDSNKGVVQVDVFGGSVEVAGTEAQPGQRVMVLTSSDQDHTPKISDATSTSLNDYVIGVLKGVSNRQTAYTADELDNVTEQRAADKQAAQQASINAGQSADGPTCIVEIDCKSVLSNMDKLAAGKSQYIPADGIILPETTVTFSDGDTAYDVLYRVCSSTGIQLETTWQAAYNGQYIDGINNLYALDCGEGTGWLYFVNGWSPNFGISAYQVQEGDVIRFAYTCTGMDFEE